MKNLQISIYNNSKDNKGTVTTVADALEIINSDELSNHIIAIQQAPTKEAQTLLKKKLSAVTWSGRFSKRNASSLLQYTNIICMDFDTIPVNILASTKQALTKDKYTLSVFYSPSGKGLKLLVKVSSGPELHKIAFAQLANYYSINYNLAADESGKDICRLCYLSWDISTYINESAEIYQVDENTTTQVTSSPSTPVNSNDQFASLRTFTDNKATYTEGSRNTYINLFVMNCKTHGIAKDDTLNYCLGAFADWDEGQKGLNAVVKSVYDNNKIEFGKHRHIPKQDSTSNKPVAKLAPANKPKYNETTLFWYVTEQVDKGTGEVKEKHCFDHDGLAWFMANNGFRKLKLGDKGYQFVRINGNLVEALEPDELNGFIIEYLQQHVATNKDGIYDMSSIDDPLRDVRRMYMRGINNYSKPAIYSALPAIQPKFLRDTETHTYLYFKNGFVEITKETITLKDYSQLNANIWSKQKKDFDIKILPESEIDQSDTWRFLSLAIVGKGPATAEDEQKLLSATTSLGYLIDTHKDPTNSKAVILCDKELNKTGRDSHGGSGKSIVGNQFLSRMVNRCLMDGKDFDFKNPYPYETLRADHKLIVYNDVDKKFPFVKLFHKITENLEYKKKYVDAIEIPFEDSPKHVIISNFSIEGEGSSFRRRQQFIEFSNYFNDEHTPKDEFNHRLFIDWDEDEWNRFYNTMFICVQNFKRNGLVPFPSGNIKLNKLYQTTGEVFVDWMDTKYIRTDDNPQPIYYDVKLDRAQVFTTFREECREYSKMENSNTFTSWVKMWLDVRGYELNAHKNGGHDKSGSTYYWRITEKTKK